MSLLYVEVSHLGLIALVIVGLPLFASLCLTAPALLLGESGFRAALRHSRDLAGGHYWRLFGALGTVFVVVSLLSPAVLVAVLRGLISVIPVVPSLWLAVIAAAGVTGPVVAIAVTVTYLTLSEQKTTDAVV
jgi:hypothetical protein